MTNILQLISAILGVIAVLFLAYYLTRFYAKKMGTTFAGGRNMKVIDRIAVGRGSAIAIIEVSGEQYMVGISETSINLITKMEKPLILPEVETMQAASFLKTLKNVVVRDTNDEQNDDNTK